MKTMPGHPSIAKNNLGIHKVIKKPAGLLSFLVIDALNQCMISFPHFWKGRAVDLDRLDRTG